MNEINKKKLCLIYSQENNNEDVLFSAVADMWAYSFSKRDPIKETRKEHLSKGDLQDNLQKASLIRVKSHGFYDFFFVTNRIVSETSHK